MKEIVLSALAILSLGHVEAISPAGAVEKREAEERIRKEAQAEQEKDNAYTPQQALVNADGYQFFKDEFEPDTKPEKAAQDRIINYIKDHCKGFGLNRRFKKLAKAIKNHNTVAISNCLHEIAAFKTKPEWKSEEITEVRHAVLDYFVGQEGVYGALIAAAREDLAD